MLMIAQFIPYIAFAGATLLLGWVAVDMLRAHVRKPRLAPVLPPAPERGLAAPPVPLSARLPITVRDTELIIPTTHAQDFVQPAPSQSSESAAQEEVPAITIDANSERREAATSAIVYNDPVVRRDPSVRVYDAVVAPSERRMSDARQ